MHSYTIASTPPASNPMHQQQSRESSVSSVYHDALSDSDATDNVRVKVIALHVVLLTHARWGIGTDQQ
jgi:hypothetical protein